MDDQHETIALVTGGTRGIGRMIAARLVKDGCRVIITGRDPAHLRDVGQEIGAAEVAVADATQSERVRELVNGIVARWGRVDVLVNNAGVAEFDAALADAPIADWWNVIDVNLRGAAIAMHAVLPHMIEQRSGLILNIGSYTALTPTPGSAAYGASKAALAHLTASVAAEVADDSVTVLCVSPGLVETDMTRDQERFQGLPADAWTPIGEIGRLVSDLVADPPHDLSGRFLHARDDVDAIRANTERVVAEDLYRLDMSGLDGRIV